MDSLRRFVVGCVAVVIGCSSAAPASAAPASCGERMRRLGARLDALGRMASFGADATRLVPAGRGRPIDEKGWYVELAADGTARFQGDPSGTDLRRELATALALSEKVGPSAPVYLAAAAEAPMGAVAKAIAELRAGGHRGEARLLVSVPAPPSEPTDAALFAAPSVAALRKEMAGKDLHGRATALSQALKSAVKGCNPVIRVFTTTMSTPGEGKIAVFRTAPAAARECGCAMADLDVFEFAMLSFSHALEPGLRWIPIPRGKGDRRTVRDAVGAAK